jgi:sulfite exporter TauE/SafE
MEFIIVAFILGLMGSFHCVGMCGPIALALPVHNLSTVKKVIGIALYNIGRLFTYFSIGLLFGFFGLGIKIAGLQQSLSITAGVLMILFLLFPRLNSLFGSQFGFFFHLTSKAKTKMMLLFREHKMTSLFSIGFLNGFLPCGLIYTALIGALAIGSDLGGGFFMLAFGIGTLPLMLLVLIARDVLPVSFRNFINKASPYLVGVMGIALILRGLDLGIPYLSPKVDAAGTILNLCHIK